MGKGASTDKGSKTKLSLFSRVTFKETLLLARGNRKEILEYIKNNKSDISLRFGPDLHELIGFVPGGLTEDEHNLLDEFVSK